MSTVEPLKLDPRNAPAFRKTRAANPSPRLVVGNPISTRLESGIGNCFPGLECDLRNLERRFFPFLEVDLIPAPASIDVAFVDMDRVAAARGKGDLTDKTFKAYETLSHGAWTVATMTGTFGPLGRLHLTIADLPDTSSGKRRLPSTPWTAVRLLTEGTDVRLVLRRKNAGPRPEKVELTAKRERYLGDDGALAEMFAPGELTQSLCSPWTHDFRDCACFYWASNHPDIAMPPLPSTPTHDPRWDIPVPWERRARTLDVLPKSASFEDPENDELQYYEINRRWQELNFVIERREQIGPYVQRTFKGKPLSTPEELAQHLRYAAGVELAVLQEYLAAAFSLRSDEELRGGLLGDVQVTRAELMRIAIGEMNHLRAVNDVLAHRVGRPAYTPALGVATAIPGTKPGRTIRVTPTALTADALERFIAIEAPSESVDSVYARILATLEQNPGGNDVQNDVQVIRTIMAEGEDHYRTFLWIQEWLKPHAQAQYLRGANLTRPPRGHAAHRTLQTRYVALLKLLYDGYKEGMPGGARDLNAARTAMVGPVGIEAAATAVARAGFLVVFDVPPDRRFAPVTPP